VLFGDADVEETVGEPFADGRSARRSALRTELIVPTVLRGPGTGGRCRSASAAEMSSACEAGAAPAP
jgi:hypothetical protein